MNPIDEYSERLAKREKSLARLNRLHERIGMVRLGVAAGFLVLAWSCLARDSSSVWPAAAAAIFLALILYHQRIQTQRSFAQRAVAFYRDGLDRLRERRPANGPSGERFLDEHHIYAADLDLFGKQSLYRTLCRARTPMGEDALARWLLQPADVATIHERHVSVGELRGRLDLREDLALLGEPPRIALQSDTITNWIDAPDELSRPWLPIAAVLLTAGAAVTAAAWAIWGLGFPFLAVLVVEAALN
jgi:hypothetical protein